MIWFGGAVVGLLSLLLLHFGLAGFLHVLAARLYRGSLPVRADGRRASLALLLLISPPGLVAAVGVSAMLHFAEGGGARAGLLAACSRFHAHCDLLALGGGREGLVYSGLTLLILAALTWAVWCAVTPSLRVLRLSRLPLSVAEETTLSAARQASGLSAEVRVVGGVSGLAATAGFLRPCVVLSRDVFDLLDTAQLTAVLGHERGHVDAFDSLRSLALRFTMALAPPLGAAKLGERAYALEREILCDSGAVARGADPLALADALLAVARLHGGEPLAVVSGALGQQDVLSGLAVRVRLLVTGDTDPLSEAVSPMRTRWFVATGLSAVVAALVLPHAAFPFVASVHCGVESLVHLLI